MNCFFCSGEGTSAAALATCVECGCAACDRHGAVDLIVTSVRTGNMFEERPARARRFRCVACRSLVDLQGDERVPTSAAAG
ncbi:MAG: DUF2180 family protein [Chloroflexota bacterium]